MRIESPVSLSLDAKGPRDTHSTGGYCPAQGETPQMRACCNVVDDVYNELHDGHAGHDEHDGHNDHA